MANEQAPLPVDSVVATGPDTLAGRYLRRFWQPVFLADDLHPGRARPLHILSEDFTLYRGETGAYHVAAFRCAHRGTQLSTGRVEDDCIRCFYHGWKYDPSGACIERPAERSTPAGRIRIRTYPTREYLGLVFAYLGDGEPPEFPRWFGFERDGVLFTERFPRLCNYFQDLENGTDDFHVHFAHEEGFREHGMTTLLKITAEETSFGMVQYGRRPGEPDRNTLLHMPNILEVSIPPADEQSGWLHALRWRVPVTDEESVSFAVDFAPVTGEAAQRLKEKRAERDRRLADVRPAHEVARDVLAGRCDIRDVRDHPHIIRIQDDVAQTGQGRIADRSHELLGASDRGVMLLRKLWLRELDALRAGGPLTEWKRGVDVGATSGVGP